MNKQLMIEASRFRSKSERRTFWRDMLMTVAFVVIVFTTIFIL
jgi:hypothetical protein